MKLDKFLVVMFIIHVYSPLGQKHKHKHSQEAQNKKKQFNSGTVTNSDLFATFFCQRTQTETQTELKSAQRDTNLRAGTLQRDRTF